MNVRTALITGGSAGIGLAVGRALVHDGWGVTIVARNESRLAAAASELRTAGAEVGTVAANMAKDEAVAVVVDAHLERFGGMDLLVNNAGVGLIGPIVEKSARALDLELALNFRSAYRMIQASIPALVQAAARHGKALIVNVSSLTALENPPNGSVYAATKAALVSLSRSAHAELSRKGVLVTALLPGLVDTPGASWADPSIRDQMLLPSDVAEAVLFLLRTSGRCFVPEIIMSSAGPSVLHSPIDWDSVATRRR
jgi:short-subunit dehydrogenase